MKKKWITLAVCFILCLCTLGMTACGGTGDDGGGGDDYEINITPDKQTEATLRVAMTNFAEEKDMITEVAKVFNKTYPNVKVELKPYSGVTATAIQTDYRNKNMADIFFNTTFDMLALSENDKIMLDMQEYVDAEEKAGSFDHNDYYDAWWNLGRHNDSQYIISRSADRVVCHLNMDIIERADTWYRASDYYTQPGGNIEILKLIKNGWTWQDWEKVCGVLRKYYDEGIEQRNMYLVNAFVTAESVFNPIFKSYDVEYFDADKKVALDSNNTKEALTYIKKMVDERWIAPLTMSPADFEGGKAPMMFHSISYSIVRKELLSTDSYSERADEIDDIYKVVTVPVRPGHEKIGGGLAGYSIYRGSEHRDLAWQFLKCMLTKEGQNALTNAGVNYVSVRKDMADASDPSNAWAAKYPNADLSAYTYNMGANGDPDWSCYTDFIAVKPKQANNLLTTITQLIQQFAQTGNYESSMKTCVNNLNRYLAMR